MSARGEPGDEDYAGQDRQAGLTPAQTALLQPQGSDDEFEVLEVDDRDQPIGGQQQPEPQDNRLTTEQGGEKPLIRPADDGTQPPGGGRRPEEYSTRSSRRRAGKEARQNDERQRQELEAENRRLNDRLTNLEGVVSTTVAPRLAELGEANIRQQLSDVDRQLADENSRYNEATRRISEAMTAADNDGLVKALEARDIALVRKTQLGNTKTTIEVEINKRGRGAQPSGGDRMPAPQQGQDFDNRRAAPQQAPAPLPQRTQQHIQQFRNDYSWYDPAGRDMDSKTVMLLDQDIANRGFDATTQDYWDELDRMMQERMPWRFQDERGGQAPEDGQQRQPQQRQAAPQPQRRGPPVPGPADRAPQGGGGRQAVKINPQRKEAMILSGSIDSAGRVIDNIKYKKQLKQYMDFDRNNAPRGG